jgi:hypothetical protein
LTAASGKPIVAAWSSGDKAMKLHAAFVGSLLLLLSAGAASGEYLYSVQYGFAADFPGAPTVSLPNGSARDAGGNYISTAVVVSSTKPGVDHAFVSVDNYVVDTTLDAAPTLTARRDAFLRGLDATLASSHEGSVGDYPALFFSYQMNDRSAATGDVTIVIVQTAKPRVFLVGTTHTSKASAADIAALAKFLASFRIQ